MCSHNCIWICVFSKWQWEVFWEHNVLFLWYQIWKWADAVFPEVSSVVLVIILRASACVCVCACSSVFPVLSCVFLCCLLLDSPPLCFSSLNNTSVRCSLRIRAREEERETWGHQERVKERQKKGEEDRGKKKSFERLLTSKLTAIAVLARGESTSKHTGWVMMWRDYKSKVIHNKQCSLCQLTYMRLVLRKKMEALERSAKGPCKRGLLLLTLCTHCNMSASTHRFT